MAWQDDYYAGSSDYPLAGDIDDATALELDPWADPAYVRNEDAE